MRKFFYSGERIRPGCGSTRLASNDRRTRRPPEHARARVLPNFKFVCADFILFSKFIAPAMRKFFIFALIIRLPLRQQLM
jgi:hypothetical protein